MGLPRLLSVSIKFNGELRKLVLKKDKSETFLHILIKVLSYVYFWEEDLDIEPNYEFRKYKPDLLRLDPPDNPREITPQVGRWVECKNVKFQKLDNLARYLHGDIHWFHTKHHLGKLLIDKWYKKYRRLKDIDIIGIECESEEILLRYLKSNDTTWEFHTVEKDVENRSFNQLKVIFLNLDGLDQQFRISYFSFSDN